MENLRQDKEKRDFLNLIGSFEESSRLYWLKVLIKQGYIEAGTAGRVFYYKGGV